jgi:Flp pilus assembly pilin Flp
MKLLIGMWRNERGAATAEYAIATVAAAGFAGLLALVLKSGPIQTMLTSLISGALSVVGQ